MGNFNIYHFTQPQTGLIELLLCISYNLYFLKFSFKTIVLYKSFKSGLYINTIVVINYLLIA